jgi:hypothetical protein
LQGLGPVGHNSRELAIPIQAMADEPYEIYVQMLTGKTITLDLKDL